MRISSRGQVTIPIAIRRELRLLPSTEILFEIEGNAVRLVKAPHKGGQRRDALARLGGKADTRMTTDQILALTRR